MLWFPSELYRLVTAMRNRLYDLGILKSHSFDLPVICVGNITAGGTGKTPHVMWLSEKLSHQTDIAILSRGYLRKSSGFRQVVANDTVSNAGDEPLLMARRLGKSRVFVDRDRVNGIKEIIRRYPQTGTIILDDGFQHRAVKAGLNIVLTSHDRLITRDHMLPMGMLRESLRAIIRADIIIVTKVPPGTTSEEMAAIREELMAAGARNIFFTRLTYEKPVPLFDGGRRELTGTSSVLLVSGIASPGPLAQYLTIITANVRHIRFPDHHMYTDRDLSLIESSYYGMAGGDTMIITTEKDAVRLKEFTNIADHLRQAFYYLPVGIEFIGDENIFLNEIYGYAGKDKKDR